IELIASENYAYAAVREAQGTILTNKYAEGYPGKRYYAGCEHIDSVEDLARTRALQLFPGSEHVNVQPHSGASANIAAFDTLMKPGDPFVAMSLSQGGHLSHGAPVNVSGKWFTPHFYGVREDDGLIDWEGVERAVAEAKPKVVIAGASAYPRTLDFKRFAEIAHAAGAKLMVDMAHISGVIAAGLHPSPFPHADIVTSTTHKTLRGPRGGIAFARAADGAAIDRSVFPGSQGGPLMHVIGAKAVAFSLALEPEFRSYMKRTLENAQVLAAALASNGFGVVTGGTDNHLILCDVTPLGVTGKEATAALETAGITINKNSIPGETRSPMVTSGVRYGTPAATTRGMGPAEMEQIAVWSAEAIARREDTAALARIEAEVTKMARAFPVPGADASALAEAGDAQSSRSTT
ncbi:MAG: serine hydroxymethyltransferase, partial [Candidatus Limnocylindrus sp.]